MKIAPAFLMLGSAVAAASGSAAIASSPTQGECAVTRILPDGREVRSRGKASSYVRRDGGASHASATSSSQSSARSSVSVSSSSGTGRGHARAVTSYTNEQGHQVTTVRDETGCKITLDERDATDTGEE